MGVDAQHPDYADNQERWTMMRACEEGEERVKQDGETWLPKPSGFTVQADNGAEFYKGYKLRATFPDILHPTLNGMLGVIHRVEAKITGLEEGKPLAYMWERATRYDALPLEAFHRRITAEILLMGRYAILTDAPSEETASAANKGLPYLCGYSAEQLINWSQFDRDLFVLDESRKVHVEGDEFSWIDEKRFRVLRVTDGVYTNQQYDKDSAGGELITPQARGNKPLEEIPLVVVGPRELSVQNIERPPLHGVARASISIYRLDADYRWQLFNSGQETAVIIGGDPEHMPAVMGSGVIIGVPLQGDVKYACASGVGIEAHRQAISDERQNAVAAGVKLFETAKAESGDALRLRASANTATLTTIAQASAAALERALRYAAMFVGQDPNEIVVKPNLAFVDTKMATKDASDLVAVWQSGAFSHLTLYENLQRGEIASSERTYEEEKALIDQEIADQPAAGGNGLLGGGGSAGGGGGNLNNSGGNLNNSGDPSRFVEDGTGLQIEPA
jgi:hypothetical protein